MRLRTVLASAALAGAACASYIKWIRPRTMHWGASEEEAARSLPFDDVCPNAPWNATRAVTVEATPEQIWPWLVQIGWGRAGWYGYDWVDNGGRPSAWEILPEHQHLEIGRDFPMSPWTAVYCKAFEEPWWMLWRTSDTAGTWLWYLDPLDSQRTRLITRMRGVYHWTNPILLPQEIAVDLFDIIFMRKCLLGIKARAEAMARGQVPTP